MLGIESSGVSDFLEVICSMTILSNYGWLALKLEPVAAVATAATKASDFEYVLPSSTF